MALQIGFGSKLSNRQDGDADAHGLLTAPSRTGVAGSIHGQAHIALVNQATNPAALDHIQADFNSGMAGQKNRVDLQVLMVLHSPTQM